MRIQLLFNRLSLINSLSTHRTPPVGDDAICVAAGVQRVLTSRLGERLGTVELTRRVLVTLQLLGHLSRSYIHLTALCAGSCK